MRTREREVEREGGGEKEGEREEERGRKGEYNVPTLLVHETLRC